MSLSLLRETHEPSIFSLIPVFYVDLGDYTECDTPVITGEITSAQSIDSSSFVLLLDPLSEPCLSVLAECHFLRTSEDHTGIVYQYSYNVSDVALPCPETSSLCNFEELSNGSVYAGREY